MAAPTLAGYITSLRLQTFTQIAASALITYDFLLTLPLESVLVWRGNWGVPAALYMFNRYGVLVHSYTVVALMPRLMSTGAPSLEVGSALYTYCRFWGVFASWSIPAVTLLAEALLTMRLAVFYGHRRTVVLMLWAVYLLCAGASITVMILGLRDTQVYRSPSCSDDRHGDCINYGRFQMDCNGGMLEWTWAFWAPGVVMEFVLVMTTLARAVQYWAKGVHSTLVTVITQDNLLYFVCVFALMVANLLLCASPSLNQLFGVITELTLCINSILAGRIFLHLRAKGHPELVYD